MIIREILHDPTRLDRFDYFNDYRDTKQWLDEGLRVRQELLQRLEEGRAEYQAAHAGTRPEVMTLSTEGARTFVEALLNPRPPSERMQAAYARHQARYRKPNLTCGNCERWHTCNDASYEAVNRPCLVPKEAP